ncbi:hypothetical protein N0V88_002395 [Collariella sp. IMI 366227]|nr:hypothetical protein N0V88_002395 [Collariella sp. IMI 366227]
MRFDFLVLAALAGASTLTPNTLPLIVGFSVMAAVPETSTVYPLLGRPQDSLQHDSKHYNVSYPKYLGATFDASTTNLTYRIPGASDDEYAQLTLSFLSPITPSSTFRQSIPAAYVTVIAEGCLDVNIYTDTNGEWVTGNRDNEIKWEMNKISKFEGNVTKVLHTWTVERVHQQLFTEFADRAEWGTLYFTAPAGVHYQSGTSALLRQRFAEKGILKDVEDRKWRKVMDEEPVGAFSKSFNLTGKQKSSCHKRQDSVTFTFALLQDPVVQFARPGGITPLPPLWQSYLPTAIDLITYHYDDFPTASALALNYSLSLSHDAHTSGSQQYADIASLSARQVLGATQFAGTPSNPLLFLKEISSDGNTQTVDVIFPAFPFFLYTNPRWLGYLLEPLLEHQRAGLYPNDYSMHDLGSSFPNATGHPDGRDEYMPVEECGNMLIMALAMANALRFELFEPAGFRLAGHGEGKEWGVQKLVLGTLEEWEYESNQYGFDLWKGGEGEMHDTGEHQAEQWLGRSEKLWRQWTGYLVRESLVPHNQLSTDDFAGWLANQTNLALKGIIGIRAMSEISEILGQEEYAREYREIADEYVKKWEGYGVARDGTHAKLAYTWYGSWTTLYNLYADSLLCFRVKEEDRPKGWVGAPRRERIGDWSWKKEKGPFVPDKVYQMQSDWYHAVLQRYGLPLDSRHLYTKSDWEFFAAAVSGKETRREILTAVARWVNETITDRPFTDFVIVCE